ncbi:MAG: hypothetical protein ACTSWE_01440, partial [Promethearchaeota archaeon]
MLEIIQENKSIYKTREIILIEFLKDGHDFLKEFEIDPILAQESISLIYHFFKKCSRIPHNAYKFFIAAYYIIERHPKAFPNHKSKKKFCKKFGIKVSALEYSVQRIESELSLIKILDDKNYPYYFQPRRDICFQLVKRIAEKKVDTAMMNFWLKNDIINPHFLTEELVNEIIFERKFYPEELFRQFYEIFYEVILNLLDQYEEYHE